MSIYEMGIGMYTGIEAFKEDEKPAYVVEYVMFVLSTFVIQIVFMNMLISLMGEQLS